MKQELSTKASLFTGLFTGVVFFLWSYMVPEANDKILTSIAVGSLAAFLGSLLGSKLFPSQKQGTR
ncbi:hypothetical protein [Halobacillus ihumii]|uniref:hypothetical protein n=1 Tax=Halobacillus ihumii TaxID=2686092 RepID=UPI0013D16041|nr:hypothetical protein [Halobacillus ihumii]